MTPAMFFFSGTWESNLGEFYPTVRIRVSPLPGMILSNGCPMAKPFCNPGMNENNWVKSQEPEEVAWQQSVAVLLAWNVRVFPSPNFSAAKPAVKEQLTLAANNSNSPGVG